MSLTELDRHSVCGYEVVVYQGTQNGRSQEEPRAQGPRPSSAPVGESSESQEECELPQWAEHFAESLGYAYGKAKPKVEHGWDDMKVELHRIKLAAEAGAERGRANARQSKT